MVRTVDWENGRQWSGDAVIEKELGAETTSRIRPELDRFASDLQSAIKREFKIMCLRPSADDNALGWVVRQ